VTDEELTDLEDTVFASEWHLPYDSALGMVAYTMVQEVATQLHYRNLRRILGGKCPALDRVLHLLAIDEAAHGHFFAEVVALHLEADREGTVDQLRRVFGAFDMPAVHLLSESRRRAAAVRELNIVHEGIYLQEVVPPLLRRLGLTREELRSRRWRSAGG
jgi:acyl-[acyl-carrier-protein] desaturase